MAKQPATGSTPVSDLSFRDASAELDAIIDELDRGVADIDVLGEKFARAADIAEELSRRLDASRRRIDEIAPRLARLARGSDADDDDELDEDDDEDDD